MSDSKKPTSVYEALEGDAMAPTEKPAAPAEEVVEKQRYYRIRKISGFLYELLETEVNEATNPPVTVGKQDVRENVMNHAATYLYPHPDTQRARDRNRGRK